MASVEHFEEWLKIQNVSEDGSYLAWEHFVRETSEVPGYEHLDLIPIPEYISYVLDQVFAAGTHTPIRYEAYGILWKYAIDHMTVQSRVSLRYLK